MKSPKNTTRKPFDPIIQVLLDIIPEMTTGEMEYNKLYDVSFGFHAGDTEFVDACVERLRYMVFEASAFAVDNLTKQICHEVNSNYIQVDGEYNSYNFTIRLSMNDVREATCDLTIEFRSNEFENVVIRDTREFHTVKEIKAAFGTFGTELPKRCVMEAARLLGLTVTPYRKEK